jgi:hypothetical protein
VKVLALAAVALAGAASTTLDLRTVILRPAQVGKGYILVARKDGFGVKSAPTLDLCGRKGYASEKLRADRLQVNYLKQNTALGLSNEVVAYRPGGAKKALGEVLRHATACPHSPVFTGEPGVGPLKFTITPVHDSKLLAGYVAVRVHAVGKLKNGKHVDQTSYAVYQRRGDVLSGIYSFGPNTAAQLQFALHAAEQSAALLRKAVSKPKGPPA